MRLAKLLPFVAALGLAAGATMAVAKTPPPRVDMPYAMTVRILDDQAGKYEVEVDNTNPTRFIRSFRWTPPPGIDVTAVDHAIGGHCNVEGGSIVCTGLAAPPSSVNGVGAPLIVDFTGTGRRPTWANGYWIHYGVVGSVAIQTAKFSDVPICKSGQKSTTARPCASL
jgi:hypothetical protein